MPKNPNRGALPHRTVQPRPGELPEHKKDIDLDTTDAREIAGPFPFVPVLYADAKTLDPTHLMLRCPTCGFMHVMVTGVGVLRREDSYDEVERVAVDAWEGTEDSVHWRTVPGIENVRQDSLMIEMRCDFGHVAVLELGRHKSLTSVRLTRVDTPVDEE